MADTFQQTWPNVEVANIPIEKPPLAAALPPDLVWLGDATCCEAILVGGKAAQLSHLAGLHRVPPGFCLPASAYDPASALAGALRPTLARLVIGAYAELAERTGIPFVPVAVRSSAVDEDGEQVSFAGQYSTELNVIGAVAVLAAVARCWDSAGTERALAYRHRQGLPVDGVRVAVLVQQLVISDVSAVVFSINPVSGNRDEIVVTASWGLGESLVSATTTPDMWLVRKEDLAIVSESIGAKERMTVAVPGGTRDVPVPRLMRSRLCLTPDRVVELARLAASLEVRLGRPVDIETAYCEDRLYLLQCRPVTAIR
jgi:phosphoenolpyruvate synthase/pyruvate phosphate dikinase